MKNKLTDVLCTYTGGGIYVVTARLNDVYLATDFENCGTYDVPWEDIEEKYGCDYESHEKASAFPLPTWAELIEAVRESYESGSSTNMDMTEVEQSIRHCHPDLRRRLNEPDPSWTESHDRNSERLETICDFIEVFEEFLDEKGIVIPNDEKEQDPDASNIYGTDYGILSDMLEPLLIRYGVLKEEV